MSDLENLANAARGEVPITLGGETYALRPSFRAVQLIEQNVASLREVYNRLSQGELSVTDTVFIVKAGLIGQQVARRKDLDDFIYKSNPTSLLIPVLRFINSALTGGEDTLDQLAEAAAEEGPGGNPPKAETA